MKKEWIELGAILLGGAALYYVMSRGGMSQDMTPTATDDGTSPSYLAYNQNNPNAVPLSNVSPYPNTANQPSPGAPACASCSPSVISFTGSGAFEQVMQQELGSVIDSYQASIASQYPDYVRQFFNNTIAVDDATAANTTFASMA